MLSRLALNRVRAIPVLASYKVQVALASTTEVDYTKLDYSKLPRPKRLLDPLPVRFGFAPDSWFTFFYPKTGVTGGYVFVYTVVTYFLSKEIYVIGHDFYNGLVLFLIYMTVLKKWGPQIKAYLLKECEKEEQQMRDVREDGVKQCKDIIESIKTNQMEARVQNLIMDVKKENVKMQLEATYRERLMEVYKEVKNRLDYHSQVQNVERRIAHRHMSQWIINNVLKAITPEQEKAALQQCIKDLEALAVKS